MKLPSVVSYILRAFPTPYTGNAALVVNTRPIQYDVLGAGRPVFNQLGIFSPQFIQTNSVTQQGYGGLLTGQIAMQPLSDTDPSQVTN